MNWIRISKFAALLLLTTVVVSIPFGVIEGYTGERLSRWVMILQESMLVITWVAVFARLAHVQRERTGWHVLAAVILCCAIFHLVNVLVMESSTRNWAVNSLLLFATAAAGWGGTAWLRHRSLPS